MTYAHAFPDRSGHLALYMKLTLAALLWGGTFIAGRFLAGEVDPVAAATGRFGLALGVLICLVIRTEGRIPVLSRGQMLGTLGLGATGVFIYNIFFFAALGEMPASRTALFVAFTPIIIAAVMRVFNRAPGTHAGMPGIVIALGGVLIVVTDGNLLSAGTVFSGASGSGEVYMTIAVLAWALYTMLGRKVLSEVSPLVTTTYAAAWGFGMLLILFCFSGQAIDFGGASWGVYGAIVYLAIGGTVVPFVWYYQGVESIGPARAAVFTNLVPVFGVLLGFLILNEPLTGAMVVGGALALAGVSLANRQAG